MRLGTRGSKLALAQANTVKDLLESSEAGLTVEIVVVKTSGDRGERERLGAFVREIEEALLEDRVDVALHCLKDLPTQSVPGLVLAAHLEREDPHDAIITRERDWRSLPEGAVIGTGSVRRTGQLRAAVSGYSYRPLVGNVDTRLRKLQEGEYDAIVLAIAGLRRLGVLDDWESSPYANLTVEAIDEDTMLPAPGQAVLVLQAREGDRSVIELLSRHNDADTEACARAERAFLGAFGGGCSVPVAAMATASESEITLMGRVAAPDGSNVVEGRSKGTTGDPEQVGSDLAALLLGQGAGELFLRPRQGAGRAE